MKNMSGICRAELKNNQYRFGSLLIIPQFGMIGAIVSSSGSRSAFKCYVMKARIINLGNLFNWPLIALVH